MNTRWYGVLLVGLLVLLAACGTAPTDEPEAAAEPTTEPAAEAETEPTADQAAVPAGFPLTIENCDYTVTFDAPPERVVVNDVNILELFLALDLEEHLVGYSSVRDDKEIAPEYQAQLDGIPLLAERYPSIEVLAGANPDLYLAGWNYGMTEDSGLTPETLAPLGINTYAITESCIRIMEREQVSLEDTFTDLRNLGKIFAVEDRAEALIEQYRAELAAITETVGSVDEPLRVFVYDSGEDTPLTAARFATPNAMIEAAGGTNIFNDVDSSWTRVNWEDVVDRNPEHIVIIDYGEPDAQGKIDFLKEQPELADVAAIQNDNFVVLTYAEATPGPRNVARTRTLAEAFYPEKFADTEADDTGTGTAGATEYPLTIENCGITVTYEQTPTSIVSMNDDSTLILLALGLQDKIAGIGYATSRAIPSEYEAAYNDLNVLAEGAYPALEEIFAVEPDFIYASLRSAFEDDGAGDRESLHELDIDTYLGTEYCQEDNEVTIDTIYTDIRNLGRILDVSEQANDLVASMQADIADVQQRVESAETPLRVFFYDSGEDTPFTAGGSGMAGEIMKLAGGENIFDDIADEYGETNWELVVERDPEFVVIADYGSTTAEEKRDFLLNYAPLQDVTAIQEERFVVVPLRHVIAGLNNPKAVRTMAEAFYPKLFADSEADADEPGTTEAASATTYPLTIEQGDHTLVFEQPPERAVSLNLHTTEIMLALGLADRMVGTAFGNAPILPEFAAQYDAISILAEQYPATEVLASVEPDFTYGRSSAHREDGVGTVEDLEALGIAAYTVQGTLVEAATMDDVYTDIRNLGRIFDIQAEAEALIASMEQEIAAVQDQIGDVEEPVRVLVYDAGTDDLFTAGQSLQTHLIELAGGRNVFDDVEDNWVTVSWEEAVARNPDVIVINDYGDTPAEEKIDFLLNNPALSSLPAIQNERIMVLPLPSVFEGVRNPDAVRLLASGFYPDRFE